MEGGLLTALPVPCCAGRRTLAFLLAAPGSPVRGENKSFAIIEISGRMYVYEGRPTLFRVWASYCTAVDHHLKEETGYVYNARRRDARFSAAWRGAHGWSSSELIMHACMYARRWVASFGLGWGQNCFGGCMACLWVKDFLLGPIRRVVSRADDRIPHFHVRQALNEHSGRQKDT